MFTRYQQVSRIIDLVKPRSIVEIGTWNGDHALIMAAAALKHHPRIHYWGFDLFEEADHGTDRAELNVRSHHAMDAVEKKLTAFRESNPGFSFRLFRGDTNETLPAAGNAPWMEPGRGDSVTPATADFAYIDGGHSVETIASDHRHLRQCRSLVFDDYYEFDASGRRPDILRYGCNQVLASMDHIVLPARDELPGGGYVKMAAAGPEIMKYVAADPDAERPGSGSKKRAAVTTFSLSGYYEYGRDFIETFDRYWPRDVDLHVYCESPIPEAARDRVHFVNLHRAAPDIVEFKSRHASNRQAHGITPDGGEDYRFNAIKFCHKIFALTHCARSVDADTLYWIDADGITFRQIPHAFLDSLLPDGAYTSYLGRRATHSECGFLAFDVRHSHHAEFMDLLHEIYAHDLVFDLPEWHDSYVYDVVRRFFEQSGKIRSHDLRAGQNDDHHPFVNSPLGAYMDHFIGPRRKNAGCSFMADLRQPRDEFYWKIVPFIPEDLVVQANALGHR